MVFRFLGVFCVMIFREDSSQVSVGRYCAFSGIPGTVFSEKKAQVEVVRTAGGTGFSEKKSTGGGGEDRLFRKFEKSTVVARTVFSGILKKAQ